MCIWLNNEHPLSFVYVTESEVNAETDELFDVKMLPLLKILWCSLLYSLLGYWLSVDTGNIKLMPNPSCNPLFYISDLLGAISYIFFVETMYLQLFDSDPVELFI